MSEDLDPGLLWACTRQRWSPQIGDPTMAGWLTVAAYVLCALLALAVLRRRAGGGGAAQTFWMLTCIAMALLAVNKQLDLQSMLTALGRCVAKAQGWYEERRLFQRQFIEGLLMVTAVMLTLGLILLRRHLRRNGVALLGLAIVAGFVAVRAVGFHHFDAVINMRVQNLRYNVIFELTGLVLIAGNALALLLRRGPRPPEGGTGLR